MQLLVICIFACPGVSPFHHHIPGKTVIARKCDDHVDNDKSLFASAQVTSAVGMVLRRIALSAGYGASILSSGSFSVSLSTVWFCVVLRTFPLLWPKLRSLPPHTFTRGSVGVAAIFDSNGTEDVPQATGQPLCYTWLRFIPRRASSSSRH
jgi:hypothetical protein